MNKFSKMLVLATALSFATSAVYAGPLVVDPAAAAYPLQPTVPVSTALDPIAPTTSFWDGLGAFLITFVQVAPVCATEITGTVTKGNQVLLPGGAPKVGWFEFSLELAITAPTPPPPVKPLTNTTVPLGSAGVGVAAIAAAEKTKINGLGNTALGKQVSNYNMTNTCTATGKLVKF